MRFDEIYNATHRAVLVYITAKCARNADIGDIFQETYIALYRTLRNNPDTHIENETAFVIKIARRKLARYYNLRTRLGMFVSLHAAHDEGESDLSDAEAARFMTEDFTLTHARMDAARTFLAGKPEVTQKCFYLMYDMGLPIAEVARALGLTESNVKNRIYRTIKELRALIAD
ncbi:MAG: RNA polymerase sigma factor [Defluviitaleaceae bacterium]|nr:RNA polymerase sigma factor [Defluviitaleaceae bacterium]